MNAEHNMVLIFEGDNHPFIRLVCEAPPQAECHAKWDCQCEQWYDYRVTEDGRPQHQPDPDLPHWCTGTFVDDCSLTTWFNKFAAIEGTITIPVTPKLDDGAYTFHPIREKK